MLWVDLATKSLAFLGALLCAWPFFVDFDLRQTVDSAKGVHGASDKARKVLETVAAHFSTEKERARTRDYQSMAVGMVLIAAAFLVEAGVIVLKLAGVVAA